MQRTLTIETKEREALVAITGTLRPLVEGIEEGVLFLFVHHTTCGLTINEGADPDVKSDLLEHLGKLVPRAPHFKHLEGNSDAHIKASLMGTCLHIPITGGKLKLGTWQTVYLCEFDGPRTRRVTATIWRNQ